MRINSILTYNENLINNNYDLKQNNTNKTPSRVVASTTASTTASAVGSTTASTTASSLASTTASTTANSNAEKIDNKNPVELVPSTLKPGKFLPNCYSTFDNSKVTPALNNENCIIPADKEEIYNKISDLYDEAFSQSGIASEYKPALSIALSNEICTINPDGSKEIHTAKDNEKMGAFDNASYTSETHTIAFNGENFKDLNTDKINETLTHELYHAKVSVERNSIPKEARKEIVHEILTENIINRAERTSIVRSYDDGNYKTMSSPVMPEKMAAQYNDFAQKTLFNDDTALLDNMKEYYELKYGENSSNKSSSDKKRMKELEKELSPVLSELDKIKKDNKSCAWTHIFSELFSSKDNEVYIPQDVHWLKIWENDKECEKELLNYTISIESRYHLYKENEISSDILPENKKFDKEKAKTAIKDNIDASEGYEILNKTRKLEEDSIRSKLFGNKNDKETENFLNYYYSKEEMEAREEGYNAIISSKREQLRDKKVSKSEKKELMKEIQNIKKMKRLEKVNYENHKAQTALRNNPNDKELQKKAKFAEIAVEWEQTNLMGKAMIIGASVLFAGSIIAGAANLSKLYKTVRPSV